MRRGVVLLIVLLVAAGGGLFLWNRSRTEARQAPTLQTATVQRLSIVSSVPATGSVVAAQDSKLSFSVGGTVVEVAVQVGDQVKAGQVLGRLDPGDLQTSLRQAELRLANDQISLDKTVNPYVEQDVDNARAALRQAQAGLEAAQRNVDIVRYSTDVLQAPIDRQNEYNFYLTVHGRLLDAGASKEDLDRTWTNVVLARGRLETAQRRATDSVVNAENAVVKAQEDLDKAQAALDKVLAGPDAQAVKQSQNNVELSRIAVANAQQAIDQSTLRAPFDGRVAAVSAKVGDRVGASAQIAQVVSSGLQVQAQVDETQIASIKVTQPVQLTFDGLPQTQQRPLSGRVTTIAPVGVVQQGVVNYQVTVTVDAGAQSGLLPGMTAQASIVIARADNVLAVPNRAIRRATGGSVVQVVKNGDTKDTSVQTGLSDERYTEITGVAEGTLVALPSTSTTTTPAQNIRLPAGVGGLGGGGFQAVPGR